MTEKEKMTNGMIYDPSDETLAKERNKAHRLSYEYNQIIDENNPRREEIVKELIPNNNGVYLQGPIYFDYGINTKFGKGCFANFNLTILDCSPVEIGDNVFMGPNVSIMTPVHPLLSSERNMYVNEKGILTDKEYSKPIKIGSNCWIASNVTIIGGVTIGDDVVIGAGSVVTKDMPSSYLCAGNPCKPIRKITKEDSIYLKKGLF